MTIKTMNNSQALKQVTPMGTLKTLALLFALVWCAWPVKVEAQSDDVRQLLLDYQKLTELKNILSELYQGYQILHAGYDSIRVATQGNFVLHDDYLRSLLAVSPAVSNYPRAREILTMQSGIASICTAACQRLATSNVFTVEESGYLKQVWSDVLGACNQELTRLSTILTPGALRMTDADRLRSIDGIYENVTSQSEFLKQFNETATLLENARTAAQNDALSASGLYNLK